MSKIKVQIIVLGLVFFTFLSNGQNKTYLEIENFVSSQNIHGLPYNESKMLGENSVDILIEMLQSKKYTGHVEQNIIGALGYLGDIKAKNVLLTYVSETSGNIELKKFLSILTTFQSLGHLAQNHDSDIIEYLINWSDPEYLDTVNLNFSVGHYSKIEILEVMGKMAIQGLGISASNQALKKLDSLLLKVSLLEENRNWYWADNINEAIQINLQISKIGAHNYFTTNQKSAQ